MYQRYAATLYRQALPALDDSAYPRHMAALWRAVLRRLTPSSTTARDVAKYEACGRRAVTPMSRAAVADSPRAGGK